MGQTKNWFENHDVPNNSVHVHLAAYPMQEPVVTSHGLTGETVVECGGLSRWYRVSNGSRSSSCRYVCLCVSTSQEVATCLVSLGEIRISERVDGNQILEV